MRHHLWSKTAYDLALRASGTRRCCSPLSWRRRPVVGMRPCGGWGCRQWWHSGGRPQMVGEPLQRDLPGLLRLGRLLEIEDMMPASNHDQVDVTLQRGQPCCQALRRPDRRESITPGPGCAPPDTEERP